MTYLSGIGDLGTCFQRLGGAGSSAYQGDWVGLGLNLGTVAVKAASYAKGQSAALKAALDTVGKKILPTPTAIIDVTMVVISGVDLLNGFGPPDKGAAFTSGVDQFENVYSQLALAAPDDRDWDGDAAKAYADSNAELQKLVRRMQELDKSMQSLVAQQGAKVKEAHDVITYTQFGLGASQLIALALYLIPVVGPEISCGFQIVAAVAAGAVVFAFEMFTLQNSMSLANQVNATANSYAEVAANAVESGTFARIELTGAEETKVASFKAIADSMSGMSAFSGTPTVASLAGASPQGRAVMSVLTADGETLGDGTPAVRETPGTPATPTPPTPGFTPPTIAQVTAMSSQAAKLSGHLSQHMNLVNQAMGQIQQVASMAQQGQGAAAPAEESTVEEAGAEEAALVGAAPAEATLAGDVEGAGAGAGTAAGERAPVDVAAVGTEEAQEPTRYQ